MDELSHEFPVKPRPPGISAGFPGHGVLCLQEAALAGLLLTVPHTVPPGKNPFLGPQKFRVCTQLLAEVIFFFKETEAITIKISMVKIFLIAE